jgi:hypothetical protein
MILAVEKFLQESSAQPTNVRVGQQSANNTVATTMALSGPVSVERIWYLIHIANAATKNVSAVVVTLERLA